MIINLLHIILSELLGWTESLTIEKFLHVNFIESRLDQLERTLNYLFERLPYNAMNRLIIYLILIFLFSLVLLLPAILFSKLYIAYRKKKYASLFKKYSQFIIQFLINEFDQKDLDDLKKMKSSFRRNVMIDVFLGIDKAENSEVSSQIRKLYLELKLNEDSKKKLHSFAWHKKILGIRELSHMRVKEDNKYIMSFLQKPNEILRIEAQLGLIKLLPFVPFAFLDSQEKPFTVWEQINVFDLIRKKRIEIPEFHLWLDHWNDSVTMFCLDMIRILKQKEAIPKVMELLNHDNDLVKGKAIKTLVDLENKDAVDELKDLYFLEELPNKINIIKSIGLLQLESEMGFLLHALKEDDFKIKMACCKSIAMIGESGVMQLKKLALTADDELLKIINHVLDPRI